LLFISVPSFPVHGLGESYSLTQSAFHIQEKDNPGVTFVLNVTKATSALNYQFTWTVTDPTGGTHNVNTQVNTAPATFTTSVTYPTSFGSSSIIYVGNYTLTVSQTSPPANSNPVKTARFAVGLTDAETYQRTSPVSLTAQGYGNSENVTISISSKSGPAPGFPTTSLATSTGVLSYAWTSIPTSLPLGNYTVTLNGKTTKTIPDTQSFLVIPANMTIPQLFIGQSSLQRSQTEGFHFTASYPNTLQAKTGTATIRVTEPDGITVHNIVATYRTALSQFQGSFQIPLNSTLGVWVATIDVGGYNDGYGNSGPSSSVVRGFAVSSATLAVTASTTNASYTTGGIVGIYASVVTPGGENFTSGQVSATTFLSTRQIVNPITLSYDQSRGKWVGSYTVNSTNPSGIWVIKVNATDAFGNSGYGSTSTLVTVPSTQQPPPTPTPQSSPTFDYLWIIVIGLVAALAILASLIVHRRGSVMRKVLKVDLEAIHAEAEKVQHNEFFKNVQEQLKEQKNENQDSKGAK
jgi:hypothetical protein